MGDRTTERGKRWKQKQGPRPLLSVLWIILASALALAEMQAWRLRAETSSYSLTAIARFRPRDCWKIQFFYWGRPARIACAVRSH